MKQFILAALALMLVTGSALAQARNWSNKGLSEQIRANNNQQQGIAAPAPAPAPAAPKRSRCRRPPPPLLPASTSRRNHLSTALTLTQPRLKPALDRDAAEQNLALANGLTALVQGRHQAFEGGSYQTCRRLFNRRSRKKHSRHQGCGAAGARNFNILLNCAPARRRPGRNRSSPRCKLCSRRAGISPATVDAIGADLKAIVTEIQKSKPKLYQ